MATKKSTFFPVLWLIRYYEIYTFANSFNMDTILLKREHQVNTVGRYFNRTIPLEFSFPKDY